MRSCSTLLILSIILSPITAQITPTPTNLAQLSSVIEDKSSRYTACSQHLLTCQPTISSCAAFVCATCTALGQTLFNSCCNDDPAPTDCFAAAYSHSGPNIYPSGTTPPPAPSQGGPYGPLTDAGYQACASISDYSSKCESFSPGFTTITVFQLQAPCLCYQGTSWAPDVFDGFVQTCQSYLGVSSSMTASITSAPCRGVGNVIASLSSYRSNSGQTTTSGSLPPRPTSSSTRLPSPTASSQAVRLKIWVRSSSSSIDCLKDESLANKGSYSFPILLFPRLRCVFGDLTPDLQLAGNRMA